MPGDPAKLFTGMDHEHTIAWYGRDGWNSITVHAATPEVAKRDCVAFALEEGWRPGLWWRLREWFQGGGRGH